MYIGGNASPVKQLISYSCPWYQGHMELMSLMLSSQTNQPHGSLNKSNLVLIFERPTFYLCHSNCFFHLCDDAEEDGGHNDGDDHDDFDYTKIRSVRMNERVGNASVVQCLGRLAGIMMINLTQLERINVMICDDV